MNLFSFDNSYRIKGYRILAGVDEAGRGPWAGPVVAAAVVLPGSLVIDGLDDSKKLTSQKREILFDTIQNAALSVAVAMVSHDVIDEINILKATHLAMKEALEKISVSFDLALVDGLPIPGINCIYEAIIGGDGKSASIAAASIIAKVTRDRFMLEAAIKYPCYEFDKHKGYGTKRHHEALLKYGPCPLHRKSFRPVKDLIK